LTTDRRGRRSAPGTAGWFGMLLVLLPWIALAGEPPSPLPSPLPDMAQLAAIDDRPRLEAEIARLESPAQPAGEAERLKRLGIAWHNLAALEVKGASDRAQEWLRQAATAAPDDVQVQAFLGSAQTMVARDSWNLLMKKRQADEGIERIDRAVRAAPDDVVVRMVRVNNSIALPRLFHRRGVARQDLALLHSKRQELGIGGETFAQVCVLLGRMQAEGGDVDQAQGLFTEARAAAPESRWALQANELLESKR